MVVLMRNLIAHQYDSVPTKQMEQHAVDVSIATQTTYM